MAALGFQLAEPGPPPRTANYVLFHPGSSAPATPDCGSRRGETHGHVGIPGGMPGRQLRRSITISRPGSFAPADRDGRLVALDLGQGRRALLSPLAAFATGCALDQSLLITDRACLPSSSKTTTTTEHDVDDLFEVPGRTVVAPGADVRKINPRRKQNAIRPTPRAMATFLPTDRTTAIATSILPNVTCSCPLTDCSSARGACCHGACGGRIRRRMRTDHVGGGEWDGGATSDPVRNLQQLCDSR